MHFSCPKVPEHSREGDSDTWKDLSRLCQIQLRWMSSTTALPGCRNWALARLDVWTLTRTAVLAMTSSCSLKGVEALNSTTLTYVKHHPFLGAKLRWQVQTDPHSLISV